uniref:BPTI/Kunitz inhibitor domain-containing protein n=1 Tax=Parascaris univalens TaxID=6257 RepID=A0A915AU27_PARUN
LHHAVVLYVVVALAICRQSGSSTDDSILKTMQNDISANEEKTSNSICCATLLRPQSSYVNVTAQNVPGVSHLQTQKLYIYPQPPSFSKYGDPLQSLAVRSIPSSACNLPQQIGTGPYRIPRWYYNPARMRCELFYWSGCCGNANNFQTFHNCQQSCEVDPCTLERDQGIGPAQLQRYAFNKYTKMCEPFIYFGSAGNRNNFHSLQDCQQQCPESPNPCPHAPITPATPCASGSAVSGSCGTDQYCHTGQSPSTTVCCNRPGSVDRCSQPVVAGIGNANLQRWYFNSYSQQCQQFIYNGLRGNENNFLTQQECQNACVVNPCSRGIPYQNQGVNLQCTALNQGICPSGYYCHIGVDSRTSVCCQMLGNDPCTQALEQGQGSYSLQRWYWNAASQQCISFAYRGLKGTQNNFLTQQDCERTCHAFQNPCSLGNPQLTQDGRPLACSAAQNTCSSTYWCHFGAVSQTTVCCPGRVEGEAICRQPMTMGSGGANLQRWYFNWNTRQCVPFIYGGLFGNQNNFRTLQQCQQTCPSYVNVCPTGSPLLESNGRPRPCTFGVDNCGAGYWCHLGLVSDEYQCCVGQPTNPAACQGMPYSVGVLGSQAPAATRWYYDQQTMSCRTFQYNGLKGNQNNFLTQEDCESTCHVFINPCIEAITLPPQQCSANVDTCPSGTFCLIGMSAETSICCPSQGNPCLLPRALGTGSGFLQRWYFSSQTGSCQPFTYTGLKGNENNFLTRERCEETCGPNPCPEGRPFLGADGRPQSCNSSGQSSSCPRTYWCHTGANELNTVCCPGAVNNPCNLPLVTGEGTANLERFYFDSSAGACRPFIYNGIKGNQNNFLTLLACQMVCQPLQNPCIGQPATTAAGQVLFCSSTNKDTCPVNFWCHIGANPETTVCCPGATNPCSVPLSPGTGNAGLQRWYYNADDRECQPFQYNGMRGNQNNFESQAECARTCPEQLCLLSIDRGACGGRQTRYAFDRQTSQCVPFEYTGCGGNLNNFQTLADCMATCGALGFRR